MMTELTPTADASAAVGIEIPLAVRVAKERAAAVAVVRSLADQGNALAFIAGALNRANIPTLAGRPGAKWTHQGVRRLADAEGIKL